MPSSAEPGFGGTRQPSPRAGVRSAEGQGRGGRLFRFSGFAWRSSFRADSAFRVLPEAPRAPRASAQALQSTAPASVLAGACPRSRTLPDRLSHCVPGDPRFRAIALFGTLPRKWSIRILTTVSNASIPFPPRAAECSMRVQNRQHADRPNRNRKGPPGQEGNQNACQSTDSR